jgi:hypothetical protein
MTNEYEAPVNNKWEEKSEVAREKPQPVIQTTTNQVRSALELHSNLH